MPASTQHISTNTPMGANLVGAGATFRVWAPAAKAVHIEGDFNRWTRSDRTLLNRDEHGYWAGFVPRAVEWQQYLYYVVGEGSEGYKRDPYARELEDKWPDPKCILRRPDFPWRDHAYHTPAFHNFVIYQLHVGSFFIPEGSEHVGTFLDVVRRIEYLQDLGVTALQLLPVVEFRTQFSQGYNGTDYFSPEMDYEVKADRLPRYRRQVDRLLKKRGLPPTKPGDLKGAANQLKMLVNLCHLYGLAVILDVVYNHAGGGWWDQSIYFWDRQPTGDNNLSQFFCDRGHAGGLVFAFAKPEVRQFLIDNATYWLREYRVDGFRYDQVSVIVQEAPEHGWKFCQDLTSSVRAARPEAIQHAEYWPVDPYVTRRAEEGGAGFDTTLHDGLRRTIRNAVRRVRDGMSPDMDAIAASLLTPGFDEAWNAVQGVENHDVVYRGRDLRLPRLADQENPRSWTARSRSRLALGLIMTAPGVPMLFMGQEFLEDKAWADDFASHAGLLLYWDGWEKSQDRHMVDFHRFTRDLIALRFSEPALRSNVLRVSHVHNRNRVLAFHRWMPDLGRDVMVVASFSDTAWHAYRIGFPGVGRWREIFNSDVYDHWMNPQVEGNAGFVEAISKPLHGFQASASLTIPANGFVVFAK